ncbi:MAG: hypothetical protein LBR64_04910 [Dysgonamonadaceae bacterium]|jgi:hypothetical protein|nr:hypothetical protein [Dysgonamonadaceae bacterium]
MTKYQLLIHLYIPKRIYGLITFRHKDINKNELNNKNGKKIKKKLNFFRFLPFLTSIFSWLAQAGALLLTAA